ncbi:hypothetical protein AKJ16_DCAP09924 [Drosera capensis]
MFRTIFALDDSKTRLENRKSPRRDGPLAHPISSIEAECGLEMGEWKGEEVVRWGGDARAVASAALRWRRSHLTVIRVLADVLLSSWASAIKSSSSCLLFIAVTVVAAVKDFGIQSFMRRRCNVDNLLIIF